ncbi:hypothetical protein DH2020_033857 [Rehmannia glutinosa]|uniref:Probable magnesium transporter n=1 Tax=Rehmannia glutinosa TaxID=99300 RepID=A0ABR0VBM9_REHGL
MRMIIGRFLNFFAYIYAPVVLVTPFRASSIIVSAILAHVLLKQKLRKLGILGCILCAVGSTVIVLHAPTEHNISSVEEIWELAIQPAFLLYIASAIAVVLVLVLYCEPRYGRTNIMVYIGVCSIIGSITVMNIKAVGIAVKLTLTAIVRWPISDFGYLLWLEALDKFNSSVVYPIYYAMLISLTVFANAIMFKDCSNVVSVLSGFITVLSGAMVLHSTRNLERLPSAEPTSLLERLGFAPRCNAVFQKIVELLDEGKDETMFGLLVEFYCFYRLSIDVFSCLLDLGFLPSS